MQEKAKATVVRWQPGSNEIVFIGRPSRWGNPFRLGRDGNRAEVIRKYTVWVWQPRNAGLRAAMRRQLAGKKLGCFCVPLFCHGHIIASIVNHPGD